MTHPLPEDLTFEAALTELQGIVSKLEEGKLSLEESVDIFEYGQQLTAYCQQVLENAELRVRQLADD